MNDSMIRVVQYFHVRKTGIVAKTADFKISVRGALSFEAGMFRSSLTPIGKLGNFLSGAFKDNIEWFFLLSCLLPYQWEAQAGRLQVKSTLQPYM